MMVRQCAYSLLMAVLMLVVSPLSAQEQAPTQIQVPVPAPLPERRPEYRLGVGDSIRIQVFQNADLMLETRISENDSITFPLIGTTRIGQMALVDAEQVIAKALRDGGFIKQPQVIIVLLQNRGNQVSVLGQTNRPGRYPLDTVSVRLTEIIATAGGMSQTASDLVIVSGNREGKPFRREIDFSGMLLLDQQENDIVLKPDDVIYVDRNPVFYIYGEIQRPGAYRIERDMTVRQALALSGGLAPRGSERGLTLHRRGADGSVEAIKDPGLNHPVRRDDVLQVMQSLF